MSSQFNIFNDSMMMLSGRVGFLNNRHQVLSQNLAQLETPGYKAKDIAFEGFLEDATQNPNGVSKTIKAEVFERNDAPGLNGNNVNLEKETARITDNSIEYTTAVQILKKNLSLVKYSITEG